MAGERRDETLGGPPVHRRDDVVEWAALEGCTVEDGGEKCGRSLGPVRAVDPVAALVTRSDHRLGHEHSAVPRQRGREWRPADGAHAPGDLDRSAGVEQQAFTEEGACGRRLIHHVALRRHRDDRPRRCENIWHDDARCLAGTRWAEHEHSMLVWCKYWCSVRGAEVYAVSIRDRSGDNACQSFRARSVLRMSERGRGRIVAHEFTKRLPVTQDRRSGLTEFVRAQKA